MLSVLIIEDHFLVRLGIREMLKQEYRDVFCGEAATAAQGRTLLNKRKWNLIILDITLRDEDGLSVLGAVRRHYPSVPVLIVDSHSNDLHASLVYHMGASGYLCKSDRRAELTKGIKMVLSGREYFAAPVKAVIKGGLRPRHLDLSPREYRVMLGIAAGERLVDIADALHLSIKTVSTYKQRVMAKMKMHSAADIFQYVTEKHLLVNRS